MRCADCGTENLEGSTFCKECGAALGERDVVLDSQASTVGEAAVAVGAELPAAAPAGAVEAAAEAQPTTFAVFLSAIWNRKGPILMALFIVLMMATVFAPWAFFKLDLPVIGVRIVSNTYSGWNIFVGRILFYLLIIPLLISLLMVAGISTRRRVVETHMCTFFAGVVFTIWLMVFAISQVISSLIKNVKVLAVGAGSGQIIIIFLFIGFMIGIIITSYDRGRDLSRAAMGG